ncbi:sulfatase-like hydrolase/transferase [Halomarina ordinaria]|uniref:Sulfatase-like hydrolase/transferase n=1 Tax=Halomarina ordinaria TaxID=3033939 RepID=A0ABD5UA61_9EURY|nr:sulfatase-like hydrolase/transferase [Halomarina sp. PSRA2]
MTNIALVVLDTLRKDTFDEYFDWVPGRRYENAWSTSHYTVPAHASLFTGKYPSEIGVHAKHETLDCDSPTLAEQLSDAGYRTRALSANLLASPLNDFDRGFDEFVPTGNASGTDDDIFNWRDAIENASNAGLLRDIEVLSKCLLSDSKTLRSLKYGWKIKTDSVHSAEDSLSKIERMEFGSDEFLYVNLMDVHTPYKPPREYQTVPYEGVSIEQWAESGERNPNERLKTAYNDCARYLSDKYREIFHELEEHFDYIITVSDHGELFGEHGVGQHIWGVFPELTHVPVCISGSHRENVSSDRPTSLLDVYQTILDLAQTEKDARGESLLDSPSSNNYISECHGLRISWLNKLQEAGVERERIEKLEQTVRGVVFKRGSYVYEQAEGDLVHAGGDDADTALSEFEEIVSGLDEISVEAGEQRAYTTEVQSQLEDLGYL